MSGFRRYQLTEELFPPFFPKVSPLLAPKTFPPNPWRFPPVPVEDELEIALDLLSPSAFHGEFPDLSSPFDGFGAVTDLIQIERTPFYSSAKRVQRFGSERRHLQSLCDRVSALELGFDRVVKEEAAKKKKAARIGERKYTWTAEIKSPDEDGLDRTYKWVAEVKGGKKGALEKSYKLSTQIKGKGNESPLSRSYSFKASSIDAGESIAAEKSSKKTTKKKEEEEKNKKKKPEASSPRLVEIEEPSHHGALILKQVYAKRMEKKRGKRKELSPQDAAKLIQLTFKAYLVRRSKALRALRDLAIAKTKLKELRAMFNNFTYRRHVARDAEERQKFSEKIIVLLLTIDAIEGADILVRSTKKSMLDELEAMLDVVDPRPAAAGRSASMRRRMFDMPDSVITKEAAAGVANVVKLLNESNCSEAWEDYL